MQLLRTRSSNLQILNVGWKPRNVDFVFNIWKPENTEIKMDIIIKSDIIFFAKICFQQNTKKKLFEISARCIKDGYILGFQKILF